MDKQLIFELMEKFERSSVARLEYADGAGASLRLEKAIAATAGAAPGSVAAAPLEPAAQTEPQTRGSVVKSPLVGVFYAAPAPGAQPFVQLGQQVEKGAVLCIVEAMKNLNEIESDFAGTVSEILVSNGDAVEYGQPLMVIS